jgi:D-3-phosphoglycerate dehydrogenase / 2-oxoglutarate reductase
MKAAPLRAVVAGVDFPSLETERRILGAIGADVVDCRGLSAQETLERCRSANAVLTDYFRLSADVIGQLKRCRVICQYGVGLDQVDIVAASAAGILVTHTPEYCVDELADHALALLLAVARRITQFNRLVREGHWDYNAPGPMRRLRGRTVGLVGFGRAGRAFAQRARGLGLVAVAADPYVTGDEFEAAGVERADLRDLLARADIVSLHAPLTEDTRGLIGPAEFAAMRPGAIFINTSRGGLVDQDALVDALTSGRLAGAGLDVLASEPPALDDPLLALDAVVLTPHAGFLSIESLDAVQTQAAEEVRRVLEGGRARWAVNAREHMTG